MKPHRRPVHGWIFLDKPEEITSTQAVSRVRRLFGALKAGHAGTLDPLASGVLPIALGEATKTVPYMMDAVKSYAFTVQWGMATTTGDREGEVAAHSAVRPAAADLAAVLPEFCGVIQQRPHRFSAIHVDGVRAYDLARAGEVVELPARPVTLHALELTGHDEGAGQSQLVVTCGKGTYIRSLAEDLALRLGTCAHIVRLRRLRVGSVTLADLITPAQLEESVVPGQSLGYPDSFLQSVHRVLDDIPAFDVTDAVAHRLRQGQAVACSGQEMCAPVALALYQGQAVSLGAVRQGVFAPARVFNL
jgi:tRNA pseudouridine55 synthase